MGKNYYITNFCGQRVWPFCNTILLIVIIILLGITLHNQQKNGGNSTTQVILQSNDFSCGIPGPCQINTKTQDGKCGTPINKAQGSSCTTPCVRSGICTTDYSKTYNDGSTFMFCNATSNFECRGFCNTSSDCPIPKVLHGLTSTGIACIKSDDASSIGTCFYAQKYAEFYSSVSPTVNWFIDVPERGPTIHEISLKSEVCTYLIQNQDISEYDVLNPDPTYNKQCLKSQSFFYGLNYKDICIYQYECTRPDNLGQAINFINGGDLIYHWGIYSLSNQTVVNTGTMFANFSSFLDAFLESLP